MSLLDQVRHESVDKGKQQGTDMGTVNISIRHEDNFVVTKLTDIKIFMNTGTESSDHSLNLCIGIDFVQSRLLHIQNLTAKR